MASSDTTVAATCEAVERIVLIHPNEHSIRAIGSAFVHLDGDPSPAMIQRFIAQTRKLRERLVVQPSVLEDCFRWCLLSNLGRGLGGDACKLELTSGREDATEREMIALLEGKDREIMEWAIDNDLWAEKTEALYEVVHPVFHEVSLTVDSAG